MAAGGLSRKVKIGFGLCDLGGNLFFTIMGFYLLYFLTNQVGLDPAKAGAALLVGKVWDAVSDPLVGGLSDRTRTRWGRRRPWIFVGAFLLFGAMPLQFLPPVRGSQGTLFLWAAGVYCLLCTAYTFVNIPYGALTPELTEDYHERTVLNGYRQMSAVTGTFIGAAAVLPIVGAFSDPRTGWLVMAVIMGGVMLVTALVTVVTVPERGFGGTGPAGDGPGVFSGGGAGGGLRSWREVLRQGPFLLVLIPWALHITGVTVVQGALVYHFQYIYGRREAFQPALMLLLLCATAAIPGWVRLSRRLGKRNSYNLGMGVFAAAMTGFFFLGNRLGIRGAYALMALAGLGFAAQYAMPFAILPDVVEYDLAENGRRREGVYYGLWTFFSKMGQAFAAALTGWVLAASGYAPEAAAQTEATRQAIRLLSGLIPAAFVGAGILIHSFYPIDRAYFDKLASKARLRGA